MHTVMSYSEFYFGTRLHNRVAPGKQQQLPPEKQVQSSMRLRSSLRLCRSQKPNPPVGTVAFSLGPWIGKFTLSQRLHGSACFTMLCLGIIYRALCQDHRKSGSWGPSCGLQLLAPDWCQRGHYATTWVALQITYATQGGCCCFKHRRFQDLATMLSIKNLHQRTSSGRKASKPTPDLYHCRPGYFLRSRSIAD